MPRRRMCFALLAVLPALGAQRATVVLNPDSFWHYLEAFNRDLTFDKLHTGT